MVTDRLATAGLLAVLGMLYPRSYMVFLALMFLDIFSHWFQMYSTFISGSETHKARCLATTDHGGIPSRVEPPGLARFTLRLRARVVLQMSRPHR